MADRVCTLILSSDLPAIDTEIEKNKVREHCLELYPGREELYEMIYESRFERLWEQFRVKNIAIDRFGGVKEEASQQPILAEQGRAFSS